MLEISGNLWDIEADARCITTNGVIKKDGCLVMGAGIAKQAMIRYPGIDKRLGELVKLFGNVPCYLPEINIISFPTKNDWRDDSDLLLIEESARALKLLVDAHNFKRVVMPKPGCGLGKLDWKDVRNILLPILDNRFIIT